MSTSSVIAQSNLTKEKYKIKKVVKYIDLCCGLGGFRIGINNFQEKSNYKFKCVFSADIKEDALKCYNENFNEANPKQDIYEIDKLPEFDLLCAGFPCQPFSSAGLKKGFKDNRGGMIFKILKICKDYNPTVILLENVSNLLTLNKGEYINKIKHIFEEIGYNISFKKLNSADFGVPQSRERVFIIGHKNKYIDFDTLTYKQPKKLSDIIENDLEYTDIDSGLCDKLVNLHKKQPIYGHKLQDKRGGTNNIHSWDLGYNGIITDKQKTIMEKIMLERRKKHWAVKKNIDWMDGMPLTFDEIKTFIKDNDADLLANLSQLVEKKYLKLEKCKELKEGKRVYKKDSEEGYNICKGKLSFPISRILDPDDVSPTLTATDSCKLVFIINDKSIRRISDTEIKRICGFPDNYIISEGVNKYDLFGNMVTPPVIESLLAIIY